MTQIDILLGKITTESSPDDDLKIAQAIGLLAVLPYAPVEEAKATEPAPKASKPKKATKPKAVKKDPDPETLPPTTDEDARARYFPFISEAIKKWGEDAIKATLTKNYGKDSYNDLTLEEKTQFGEQLKTKLAEAGVAS